MSLESGICSPNFVGIKYCISQMSSLVYALNENTKIFTFNMTSYRENGTNMLILVSYMYILNSHIALHFRSIAIPDGQSNVII